jgi:hypothetical protein
MRYNINARLIYDATDGTLTLPEAMNRTASCPSPPALLYFFLRHTELVSRDEVLKKSGMTTG